MSALQEAEGDGESVSKPPRLCEIDEIMLDSVIFSSRSALVAFELDGNASMHRVVYSYSMIKDPTKHSTGMKVKERKRTRSHLRKARSRCHKPRLEPGVSIRP